MQLWLLLLLSWPAVSGESLALFYGAQPPLGELRAYDHVVLEPDHVPQAPSDELTRWYAYVSVGEVHPQRGYRADIPSSWIIGRNSAWAADIIDQSQPEWPRLFLDRVITPLWQRGYRGFFLDTLDSYQLVSHDAASRQQQEQGLLRVLQLIKQQYPQARLISNRGFELLPQAAPYIDMLVAESLYQGWDAAKNQYRPVPAADREWLSSKLKQVQQQYHKPVAVIDYVDPANRQLAAETAQRIQADGFIPWVSTPGLDQLGSSAVQNLPRKVLVWYDKSESPDIMSAFAARFLAMPLQYLGLQPEFQDMNSAPTLSNIDPRYAGIVVWGTSGNSIKLAHNLRVAREQGVRIVLLADFASGLDVSALGEWGMLSGSAARPGQKIDARIQHPAVGFEVAPVPRHAQLLPVRLAPGTGNSWLTLYQGSQPLADAVAVTRWGGYALSPFVVTQLPDQTFRWVIDPIEFLQSALALPAQPVPDVTTSVGRRVLMTHIDGDGFANRAEMPGLLFASEVMLDQVLKRYQLPTTVSVIEGETGSSGLFSPLSPRLEAIAQAIFREPYVEIASHSFSHPFKWQNLTSGEESGEGYNLPIPNYKFDLQREVAGSVAYINQKLAPSGKSTRVFLWTGDCNPGPDALEATRQSGLLAMNGGDTLMTRSTPSLTAVAALGIPKGQTFHVFAPNQNENVYTNNWTGPFYGFERVIETFELTETPRRLKPVNIYYHTYAASKLASLKSLHKVYGWAHKQPLHPQFASEYIQSVLDFNATSISRSTAGWQIRTGPMLRTVRIDNSAGYPDLQRSRNIAGFKQQGKVRYLHLSAPQAELILSGSAPKRPYLVEANGKISDWQYREHGLQARLEAHVPLQFSFANLQSCRLTADNAVLKPSQVRDNIYTYSLPNHAVATIRIECRPQGA